MTYIAALGGFVPVYDENMETTLSGVYVAGDVASIEEASTAMAEGYLAGLAIAHSLGKISDSHFDAKRQEYVKELEQLRAGPTSKKIVEGLAVLRDEIGKRVSA
jgi:sarcosine oxidase subunit alpha